MVSELVAATVASARALEESAKDAKNNKKITFLSLIIAIIVALPQLFGNNGLWPFQPTWDKVQTEIEAIVYDVFN